jgi:hypothetical protein
MRLFSFPTRRSAAAPTVADLRKVQARADAAFALADDLARDVARHRERAVEVSQSVARALESIYARHDFLARQVRELDARAKAARKAPNLAEDMAAFFGERGGNCTPVGGERPDSPPPRPTKMS